MKADGSRECIWHDSMSEREANTGTRTRAGLSQTSKLGSESSRLTKIKSAHPQNFSQVQPLHASTRCYERRREGKTGKQISPLWRGGRGISLLQPPVHAVGRVWSQHSRSSSILFSRAHVLVCVSVSAFRYVRQNQSRCSKTTMLLVAAHGTQTRY